MPYNLPLNVLDQLDRLASKIHDNLFSNLDVKAAIDCLKLEFQTINEVEEFSSLGEFANFFFENLQASDLKEITNLRFQSIFKLSLSLIESRFLSDFSKDQLVSIFNSIAILLIKHSFDDALFEKKIHLLLNFISSETQYKLMDFSQTDLEILMSCSQTLIKKEKIKRRVEVSEKIYLILKHYINIAPNGEFIKRDVKGFIDGLDICINNLNEFDDHFFDKIIGYFKRCMRKDSGSFKELLIERNLIDNLLNKIRDNLVIEVNKGIVVKLIRKSSQAEFNWQNVKDILLIVDPFFDDYHYLSDASINFIEILFNRLREKSNGMKAEVIDQLVEILSKKSFVKKFRLSESQALRPAEILVNDLMNDLLVKLSTFQICDFKIVARVIFHYSFWANGKGICLDECSVKTLNALLKFFCKVFKEESVKDPFNHQHTVIPIYHLLCGLSSLMIFNQFQPEKDLRSELKPLFSLLFLNPYKFSMIDLSNIFLSLRAVLPIEKMEFQHNHIKLLLENLLESNELLYRRDAFLNAFESVGYYISIKKGCFLNRAQELVNRFFDEHHFHDVSDKQSILRMVFALKIYATEKTLRFREQDIAKIKSIFLSYEVGRSCSTEDLKTYADSLATFIEKKIFSLDEKLFIKVTACREANQDEHLSVLLNRFNKYKNELPLIKDEKIDNNLICLSMLFKNNKQNNQKRNFQYLLDSDKQKEINFEKEVKEVKEEYIKARKGKENKKEEDSFSSIFSTFFGKTESEKNPLVHKDPKLTKRLKHQNTNSPNSYNQNNSNSVEFNNLGNDEDGFDDQGSKFSI